MAARRMLWNGSVVVRCEGISSQTIHARTAQGKSDATYRSPSMSVLAKSARPVTVAFDANWKNILECTAAEVFEMMASVYLQQYSAPLEEPKDELTAMVGLAGALC